MAARSRPRGGAPSKEDDAHEEERNMWKQIVTDMRKLKAINVRAAEVSKLILDIEEKMGDDDAVPPVREIDALQDLYREGLKLAEEEQKILKEDPHGAIHTIGILMALRTASEIDPPRTSNALKPRNPKRAKIDNDASVESPAPSPSIASSAGASRLKGSTGRSGSVSSIAREGKETSVKLEDGAISGLDGAKGASAEKAGLLVKDAEVAYKQNKTKGFEGDWIQCTIITVLGEGKQKRYEVQDPEPDENGAPGQIYKTTAATLIPIPPAGAPLPDFGKGKQVLAKYPETTTFYRAQVMGMKRDSYRLRFEGEDEIGKEQDVDRRYVLDFGAR
ncbi:MAG: SAGA HAT/Core module component [Thelocarpon impressellum]|nr:MAG: SAGA HAT/Core module component [Thelocarpon impressellum]